MSSHVPAAVAGLRRCPRLAPMPPIHGALALALAAAATAPEPPVLAAVADPSDTGGPTEPPDDVHVLARRLLQAVVEIVGADRPVVHLLRWTTTDVYAEVLRLAQRSVSSSDTAHRARTDRPRVVSVRVSSPRPDVAEVSGRVRHAGRSRAVAARLERHDGQWICTVLQLG